MMDGDTPRDRLELREPQAEDWHCLVCVLGVSSKTLTFMTVCVCVYMCVRESEEQQSRGRCLLVRCPK